MKTTVERISNLTDQLQSTVSLCAASKNRRQLLDSLSKSVVALDETISYLKESEKRHYSKARKALSAIQNVMSGMHDGLVDGELSPRQFRQANGKISTVFMPCLAEGLLAEAAAQQAEASGKEQEPSRECAVPEQTRNKIKVVISSSSEMKEAVNVVTVANSGPLVAEAGGESELEELAKQARSVLPIRIPGDFKVVRAPIVPVFPNVELSKPSVLKRLGLKHTVIAGFVVLQDQILLNVSKKRAQQANPTAKTAVHAALAMAHSVVDLLNERGASKYEIVSDNPTSNPRNTDLLMFWVLPRPRMGEVMKILGASNTPAVVKWGLPLPSEQAETERARITRLEAEKAERESRQQAELDKLGAERDKKEAERKAARERRMAEKQEGQRTADRTKKVAVRQQEAKRVQRDKPAARSPALEAKLQRLVKMNQEQYGRTKSKPKHHK